MEFSEQITCSLSGGFPVRIKRQPRVFTRDPHLFFRSLHSSAFFTVAQKTVPMILILLPAEAEVLGPFMAVMKTHGNKRIRLE